MWPMNTRQQSDCWSGAGGAWSALQMLALGAAAMYYFDPDRGRRRRALVRDKLRHSYHKAEDGLRKAAQYSRDRATGIVAETRASMTQDHADDWTICERVRSALGRAVSHPGAIEVMSLNGTVTLGGHVLAPEVDSLLSTVSRVRGVREVIDQLAVHEHPGNISSLQGQPRAARLRSCGVQANWDPFTRLLATAGGAGLTCWGLLRRDAVGLVGSTAGLLLAARGLSNVPADRLVGAGGGPRAVDVQKTIFVHAPLERAFNFFANYQNFPHFMHNVRSVRALDPVRSQWVVAGPMGIEVSWDADLVHYVPGEVIAWQSVPGATVENAGVMRFTAEHRHGEPGTRVDIKLSYNPPAGALGHLVARMFGADAKSEMDGDLARVKTMLETGHPAHDAAQPVREELVAQ